MDSKADAIRAVYKQDPNVNRQQLALQLETSTRHVFRIIRELKRDEKATQHTTPEFTIQPPPDRDIPIDELLDLREDVFNRRKVYHDYTQLIEVQVKIDGPIGIAHHGDPHIDDDGTDIPTLRKNVDIISSTPGLFAGNVGDTNNNWVGRLAHLFERQSTTSRQAWQLTEWFINSQDWLYLISGNHGCWSGSKDPIKWMVGEIGNYGPTSVRLQLNFPNGRKITINARHDFKGASQWNNAHGSMKAAQMGFRDHILVNGHRHTSGHGIVVCPATGRLSHCLQVPSYKVVDDYAIEHNFMDQMISPCPVTIIDPDAKEQKDLIVTMWSLERAADFLTWLRKRAAK